MTRTSAASGKLFLSLNQRCFVVAWYCSLPCFGFAPPSLGGAVSVSMHLLLAWGIIGPAEATDVLAPGKHEGLWTVTDL